MQQVDYIVIILYAIGIVAAGMVFSGKMKSSKDMFAAGGKSPWWVSGLSAFMTCFSAGTFVIWGGIAYKYGVVAIVINLCYGVAALLVGRWIAGVWRKAGVNSASEFLQARYGSSIVQFYTWVKGLLVMFVTGGSIYALSKVVCALMPLSEGHFLADPTTGYLSVPITSIIVCIIVVIIAFSGGLWAVLVTDVLQFIILSVSVIFVIPLIFGEVGGISSFIENVPEGFLSPVVEEYSWWFMIGWVTINFVAMGGEWAFVQRYVCVPKAKDAKKVAYLIGGLYIISPIFWMIPPLVYRVINPNADTEQAYILACQKVLPTGMIGLMIAAMASATASMATTRLNVFAGSFTEIYQRIKGHTVSEKQVVNVGRIVTIILGGIVLTGALLIPLYGYTNFIIDINTLLYIPLILPSIWGLFSKKISLWAVWVTTITGFISAYIIKFALVGDGFLTHVELFKPMVNWIADNSRITDMLSGIIVPLIMLLAFEIFSKKENEGWAKALSLKKQFETQKASTASLMPLKMIAITIFIIALAIAILALVNDEHKKLMFSFSIALAVIAYIAFKYFTKAKKALSLTD
ncbi:sodium:solute symporter family transporter [Flavivirga algicola]|uniref:Na+:solute symporter n=1 Tax=Flavivirga algicola TaxID=2729136 RepID=A0ABX1RUY5_9FLAO|nr:Na+:solute symporter [Flavivirga algicola]NMH86825.1 Na+:solute symporter [Flavivirga algicola]